MWQRDGTRASLSRVLHRPRGGSYEDWIARHEPTHAGLAVERRKASTLTYRPLISILIPASVASPELHASVSSVLDQTYDHWALCLAYPASGGPDAQTRALGLAKQDPRIRAIPDPTLDLRGETGEFVAPLLPGDRLAASALFEMVELLNAHPSLDLIYTDEDRLSQDGHRRDPFFKPDWSPELLLSVNYLTPLVIRRRLLNDVGGFSARLDGVELWDVGLRCAARGARIGHLPRVLYHRRRGGWTRTSSGLGPGERDRRARILETHLAAVGLPEAHASVSEGGVARLEWAGRGSRVSVIIPNKDHVRLLTRCLSSIMDRTTYRNFEIVIVDNASTDEATLRYYATLASSPSVRVVPFPDAFNYSLVNNLGARSATGEVLLFLNNDVEVIDAGWLTELVRWAERPEIGAVGAKLLYPGGGVQHAGIVIGMGGLADHVYRDGSEDQCGPFGSVNWYRNYMAVTGACLTMRRSVFDRVGGFDERYRVAGGDVELCLRVVEHGYRIVYTPFARLRHFEGGTRGRHAPAEDVQRLRARLAPVLDAGDRYFNPNLSIASWIPTLAPSPRILRRDGHPPADG